MVKVTQLKGLVTTPHRTSDIHLSKPHSAAPLPEAGLRPVRLSAPPTPLPAAALRQGQRVKGRGSRSGGIFPHQTPQQPPIPHGERGQPRRPRDTVLEHSAFLFTQTKLALLSVCYKQIYRKHSKAPAASPEMKRFDYEDLLLQYSFFSPTTCWEMETKKKKKCRDLGKKKWSQTGT